MSHLASCTGRRHIPMIVCIVSLRLSLRETTCKPKRLAYRNKSACSRTLGIKRTLHRSAYVGDLAADEKREPVITLDANPVHVIGFRLGLCVQQ